MKELKVKFLDIEAGKPVVLLNEVDAADMSIHMSDRVHLRKKNTQKTVIVDLAHKFVKPGEVGVFDEVAKDFNLKEGEKIQLQVAERPDSVQYIKKKMDGGQLGEMEMQSIVSDIVNDNLNDIEISSFVAASYIRNYTMDETVALTNAIISNGQTIDFGDEVVDKHCVGGVAGNRTTMIVVPIIAAAGLMMPKTSSRAITSPAGTADTMEVLADVSFPVKELTRIVKKTNACIVWTGSVNLAPADDKIIRVRYPLSLDPPGMLLASIMAKKKSVGSDYVVIDIPVGEGAKVKDLASGKELAHKFIELGNRIKINVDCLVTDGSTPIGNGIGPALEAKDVLLTLQNKGPSDLTDKSLDLAGKLLEMVGEAKKGDGHKMAQKILESGKAMNKMREIIGEQNGNPNIEPDDIRIGPKRMVIKAMDSGMVRHIDSKIISLVARTAGAPKDKGAGIHLHAKIGKNVREGDPIFTIYAKNDEKLEEAARLVKILKPMQIGGVILEEIE